MINTIEALQGLYVALGGELSDVANVTTIPDMLTAISTVAAQGASELPAVTADDNGKLLTVVNGAWDKVDKFIVTYDVFSGEVSHTFAEVLDAYNKGYDVIFKSSNVTYRLVLQTAQMFKFVASYIEDTNSNRCVYKQVTLNKNGTYYVANEKYITFDT